jgi:hypothetical protein
VNKGGNNRNGANKQKTMPPMLRIVPFIFLYFFFFVHRLAAGNLLFYRLTSLEKKNRKHHTGTCSRVFWVDAAWLGVAWLERWVVL